MSEVDRKHVYQAVRGIIEKNTGHKQPPALKLSSLHVTARSASLPKNAVRSALKALESNGEIVAFEDRDGTTRVVIREEEAMLAVIEAETDRDAPDAQVIARMNHHLDALRGNR